MKIKYIKAMKHNLLMLIYTTMFIATIIGASAIETCFNTTSQQQICFNADSGLFQQNIDLWNGQNERYGVYITNPDDESSQNAFNKFTDAISSSIESGKIDVTKLGDETKFEFKSVQDFYNVIQQSNAIGNVTLFTKADLNQETRERTLSLTSEVIDWTFILVRIIIELFKIVFDFVIVIMAIYLFFRFIPFVLKQMVLLIFKFSVRSKK